MSKEYDNIIGLRRLVNDWVTVFNYTNHYRYHSQIDTFNNIRESVKNDVAVKLKEVMMENDFITDALDEIYQDKANHRAVLLGQLEEAIKKKDLDAVKEAYLELKKEIENELT